MANKLCGWTDFFRLPLPATPAPDNDAPTSQVANRQRVLRGITPGAPACRREWPAPSERILHRKFCQIPWYLPRSSACRRVRPVASERILHREFCHGGPNGGPRRLVKLGTEERVGDGHRTDRTGLSHHRRSRSTRGLGQRERGPLSTTIRPNPNRWAGVLQQWACTLPRCWSLVVLEDEAKTSSFSSK